MPSPQQGHGRTRQKARTRAAVVQGARALLAAGEPLTVEAAAEAAEVSRTTAYRYFPTRESLLVELQLHARMPELAAIVEQTGGDPVDRVDALTETFLRFLVEHETLMREGLRLSLETPPCATPWRQGRRVRWIGDALGDALDPLPAGHRRRAIAAISATSGIEALVMLVDICGLSREEAARTARWAARALAERALADAAAARPSP
jgi:AcrR family transcriptional regulator